MGDAAGATYYELEKGALSLSKLKNTLADLGFDNNVSMMAVGWLARENKLHVIKEGKICTIKLK
ncbi:MAG TPA: winged helix-turn-helix domain-containing protein [Candidatus Nanoarchaeia archaeon]|nr:winged helix-turn-helix domain-containing protein [Candidatus Nanoarchaeia archaeon]